MKKLMMALAVVAMAAVANAASIDWKYTGVAADKGYTLYLFSSAVAAKYDTFADFTAGNMASGVVAETKVGPRTIYQISTSVLADAGVTKDMTLYFALIADGDAKTYTYGSVATTGKVYDPDAQESSPGALEIKSTMLLSSGEIGKEEPTPEPTSGLLLLLGMAGLALKRKQK